MDVMDGFMEFKFHRKVFTRLEFEFLMEESLLGSEFLLENSAQSHARKVILLEEKKEIHGV